MGPDDSPDTMTSMHIEQNDRALADFAEAFERAYQNIGQPDQPIIGVGMFSGSDLSMSEILSSQPVWGSSHYIYENDSSLSFDVVGVVKKMSKKEKRELLITLLEAFDEPEEEKSVQVKQANRLKEMLERCKKTTS